MPQESLSRKLAVIVHADVVGSTTLVQQNETIAHERIQSAFRRLSEVITTYGGITRELRGDALVAEYERASDAVAAALAFQQVNITHNAGLEDDIAGARALGMPAVLVDRARALPGHRPAIAGLDELLPLLGSDELAV